MIDELHIADLGVIREAKLPLGPGFTAITGETGAGKTMVVTALGLLMGDRADAGVVRSGAERARVTGIVATRDAEVRRIVGDAGGECSEDELLMSRIVAREGRSRASVGGAPVPVGTLAKLAGLLFVVHGQSEQLRLRSAAAQRETVDRFGGTVLRETREQYAAVFDRLAEVRRELDELTAARLARVREAEQLRAELDEIAAVDPAPGEVDELALRVERLSNIEQLRHASLAARQLLSHDADDASGVADAVSLVTDAARELERVSAADPALARVHDDLVSAGVQLSESVSELAAYASSLDAEGPDELAHAHARLAALTGLQRKYGDTIPEVLDYAARGQARLRELDGDDHRITELVSESEQMHAEEIELAGRLTELRRNAAAELAERVTGELQALALPEARFSVEISPATPNSSGADAVTMLLQPHPGATPRPVAKGASGGELSRVMLALEVVVAGADPVPTFVFDEVDAGVGGSAAIEIGKRLALLAQTSQVIVVTHLAQVAAFATNHLVVQKDSSGGYTQSSCRSVRGDERLSEIARLLSGMSDSASALEHAAELLALRPAAEK